MSPVGPNTLCRPWTRSCVSWIRSAARGLQSWRSSSSSSSSHFARSSTTAKSTRNENTSSRYSQTHTTNTHIYIDVRVVVNSWVVKEIVSRKIAANLSHTVFTSLPRDTLSTLFLSTPDFQCPHLLALLTIWSKGKSLWNAIFMHMQGSNSL